MGKRIIIVPKHHGINTMPWAWIMSQSPDVMNVPLPPHQFISFSNGSCGMYPDISRDSLLQPLAGSNDPAQLKVAEIMEQFIEFGVDGMQTNPWREQKYWQPLMDELFSAMEEAEIPGLVIVAPTYAFVDQYIACAEHYDGKHEVQSLFVKSNMKFDVEQRWYFLYNAFAGDDVVDIDQADAELIDVVNSEMKKSTKRWDHQVNVMDGTREAMVAHSFSALKLTPPEDCNAIAARIKQHLESYKQPTHDPYDERWDGIHAMDWDSWVMSLDVEHLTDNNKNIANLFIDMPKELKEESIGPGDPVDTQNTIL